MPRSNKACGPQLLSLSSRAQEPQLPDPQAETTEASVTKACALQREKQRNGRQLGRSPPLTATKETLSIATKAQCSQK